MKNTVPSTEDLYRQLQNIKHSNVLGRSSNLSKLLEYLVEKEIQRIEQQPALIHPPKEIEIAINVFKKNVDFNSTENASVRVHISRLRKKLEEYYLDEGANEDLRISIPVGEYRLAFIQNNTINKVDNNIKINLRHEKTLRLKPILWRQKFILSICIISLVIHVLIFTFFNKNTLNTNNINSHTIWSDFQSPQYKNIIVLGAPMSSIEGSNIEGDFKGSTNLSSLHNESVSKSLVLAFKNLLSISDNFRYTQVILSSALTAYEIKHANIIYIGHFENMGVLQNYFKSSAYQYNSVLKQLEHKSTGQIYLSPENDMTNQYTDYGLFAKVDGPRNNKIYIMSGFTDSSLLWLSWFLTNEVNPTSKEFEGSIAHYDLNQGNNVELLFKIPSMNGQDLSHELISSSKIVSENIWNLP
ncbi:hypothetical protein [Paraglaciecola sp. L3A3]|uniref:hypothetical protein n=1 Tax=Paraglaciecola sp. L3A3 TaxID=2686358 RepID=UPI00131B640E|nr:hypothetical protein [Paraglaciecola sp. L3A3]